MSSVRHQLSRMLLVLLLLGLSRPAWAVDIAGSVRGTITDPSGAVVPAAKLELINEGTNLVTSKVTDANGGYAFNLVDPGTYTVRATAQGFKASEIKGIVVETKKSVTIDLSLQVGPASEVVEVRASAVVVDTVSAQLSTNVNRTFVTELPNSGRNVLLSAAITPGLDLDPGKSQVMNITDGAAAFTNGLRYQANAFYLDGTDNTGNFRNQALQFPNPDSVQEVQVMSANSSIDLGKQPGAVFNVVTKSGTNEYHGSVSYFWHNDNMNANGWNNNHYGIPKPQDNRKEFGATAGGPIFKNRTFFFTSISLYRESTGASVNTQEPTAAMKGGDFSELLSPTLCTAGPPGTPGNNPDCIQLRNPETGLPIPGNIITPDMMDDVGLNFLNLLPTAPDGFNPSDPTKAFIWNYTNSIHNHPLLIKVDHLLGQANRFSVSWFRTWGRQTDPTNGWLQAPSWGPTLNQSRQDTISVQHTWTARPDLLVQSRFTLAKHVADRHLSDHTRDVSDLGAGANWPISMEGARKILPGIGWLPEGGPWTGKAWVSLFDQHNYNFGSTVSWIKGKHNLRFGADFQRAGVTQRDDEEGAEFSFSGHYSGVGGTLGSYLADMLLGHPTNFAVRGILDYDLNMWNNGLYFQDEWRVSRKLTITAGLRYSLKTPNVEKHNRATAYMAGAALNPQYPTRPPGLVFAGEAGIPRGFYDMDLNNFGPRLGIAYDPKGMGRTAIRVGAGYYYEVVHSTFNMLTAERDPWQPSASCTDGATSLVDPWRSCLGPHYDNPPTPLSTDITNFPFQPPFGAIAFNKPFVTPYVLQWNATFEHEIRPGIKMSAGYVGNSAFKFIQVLEGNLPVWTPTATPWNVQSRRPNQDYTSIGTNTTRARSNYHSFQVTSDIRLKGLSSMLSYVLARSRTLWDRDAAASEAVYAGTVNPYNLDGEMAPAQGSVHTFKAQVLYNFPHGFKMSSTFGIRSGFPLNVGLGASALYNGQPIGTSDWNLDGAGGERPDLVGQIQYTSGSRDERMQQWFVTEGVFAVPPPPSASNPHPFGNLQRNALRGPLSVYNNLAVLKDFHITESAYIQFRAEAYDFLNHNNLDAPNTTFGSPNFGRIFSRSDYRTMQFGVKFVF